MRRRIGTQPEVAGCADQSGAEMTEPDAIYQDPRGEGIVGTGDGPGEFEPAAAVGREWLAPRGGGHREEMARRFRARVIRIAADEDVRVVWGGIIRKDHRFGWRTRVSGIQFLQLALQRPELLGRGHIEEPPDFAGRKAGGGVLGV